MTPASPSAVPRVLLIGATSSIAQAVAREYAQRGARLMLVGRRAEALQANAADLRVRGASEADIAMLDANDIGAHAAVLAQAWQQFGGFDVALIAHGTLPDQASAQLSVAETLSCLQTNATSVIALLTDLANRFEAQGGGVIGVISSPAGDRGRASNYVYGAAKAAVTNFASGLRHRLFKRGVRVVTVLPGFVDTPMTANFPKGPLWAKPERVAADIVAALDRRNGSLYTPWFWRWIMCIVTHVPQGLFLRSKL
jgi:decaprenylphospho-beta-D-erythro-pentofuranosid-2-ulose 2-reductase